jgi:hypothetical protein
LAYQKALHRVRPTADIDVRYIAFAFELMSRADYLNESMTGSTIKHLPLEKIRALDLPLPPTQAIVRICDELDLRLSIFDSTLDGLRQLVGSVTLTPESRLGQLRKSLLWSAFTGRLVADQAGDESASALLARIAAEQQSRALTGVSRRRGPKASATVGEPAQ